MTSQFPDVLSQAHSDAAMTIRAHGALTGQCIYSGDFAYDSAAPFHLPLVLNHKNLAHECFHERGSCGNLTTDSQKLSMLFTTLRNPSRSTGLEM